MAKTSISIAAGDKAQVGTTVPFTVTVTNISPFNYSFAILVTVIYTQIEYLIVEENVSIRSGASKSYQSYFIMPNENAQIFVWVEYWKFDHWEFDNTLLIEIALEEVGIPPPPPVPPSEFGSFRVVEYIKI